MKKIILYQYGSLIVFVLIKCSLHSIYMIFWSFFGTIRYPNDNFCFKESMFHHKKSWIFFCFFLWYSVFSLGRDKCTVHVELPKHPFSKVDKRCKEFTVLIYILCKKGFFLLQIYTPLTMIVFCSWVSFCLIKTEKGGEVPARTALGKVDSNSKHIDIRYASLKFIYSEKATKFCEISTNYLSYVLPVK